MDGEVERSVDPKKQGSQVWQEGRKRAGKGRKGEDQAFAAERENGRGRESKRVRGRERE